MVMPDQIDDAQRIADQMLGDALASHHRRVDEIRRIHGRSHCADCGKEIPMKRREAVRNCRRCLTCQIEFEGGRK